MAHKNGRLKGTVRQAPLSSALRHTIGVLSLFIVAVTPLPTHVWSVCPLSNKRKPIQSPLCGSLFVHPPSGFAVRGRMTRGQCGQSSVGQGVSGRVCWRFLHAVGFIANEGALHVHICPVHTRWKCVCCHPSCTRFCQVSAEAPAPVLFALAPKK